MRGSPPAVPRSSEPDGGVPAAADPAFPRLVALLTNTPLERGHRIEILTDGPASFARLMNLLRSAERSITVQSYYCRPGAVSRELVHVLVDRARAGVDVLFLGDGFGCRRMIGSYARALRAGGVRVAVARPLRWYALHRAQRRSHLRLITVDGRIGFTGGIGLDDKWLGAGDEPGWRDTNVVFSGPAVGQLQAAFADGWAAATGHLLVGESWFPAARPKPGPTTHASPALAADALSQPAGAAAGVLYTRTGAGTAAAERYLALTLGSARRTLYITNSYFVPGSDARQLLIHAAESGVDVRVLTAGHRTDIPSTRYASRGYYAELLEAGIRIYEYQPVMMHAKTIVVDGIWSSIGSMNFDNRSLRLNDEASLLLYDTAVGRTMESIFLDDLRRSHEVHLEEFRRRPRGERALEWLIRRVARLL